MKLLHISDLHIGKRLMEVSLLEDQKYIVDQILSIIDDERPDAVLIAGDIYDRANPNAEAMELLDELLVSAGAAQGFCVMIISGNHDSPERLAYARRFLEHSRIYISPVYDGHIEPITLSDEYGEVGFLADALCPSGQRGRFFCEKNDTQRAGSGGGGDRGNAG